MQKGMTSEIPIPRVATSSTYTTDYPSIFKLPRCYIRGASHHDMIEYDLDDEDEDWLEAFNNSFARSSAAAAPSSSKNESGGERRGNRNECSITLSDEEFEKLLYTLEIACGAATEAELSRLEKTWVNLSQQDKENWAATTSPLPKQNAIEALRNASSCDEKVLDAVYEYWVRKRKLHGKPALRRLRAPPASNDQNPHNVFRPREKVARVQTRRRRESDTASLERMRHLMHSFNSAIDIFQHVIGREKLKRDVAHTEVEMQDLQVSLKHELKALHPIFETNAIERARKRKAEDAEVDSLKSVAQVRAAREEGKPLVGKRNKAAHPANQGSSQPSSENRSVFVPQYVDPPAEPEEEMLFTRTLDMSYLSHMIVPQWLDKSRCSGRFARCGRVVIDQAAQPPLGDVQEAAPLPSIPEPASLQS